MNAAVSENPIAETWRRESDAMREGGEFQRPICGVGERRGGRGGSGREVRLTRAEGAPLDCRLYLPGGTVRPERTMIAVHGIAREVDDQIAGWRSFADLTGVAVVAPAFDSAEFAGYQRLAVGAGPGRRRPDEALLRLLAWLEVGGWVRSGRLVLFGHSGGAQFAHRFLLLHPGVADAAVLSSAGWYTWPESDRPFPQGLRLPGNWVGSCRLEGILDTPVLVTVGECDTERDGALRTEPELDAVQGEDRVTRARRWVEAVGEAAAKAGRGGRIELRVLPGARHSFRDCLRAGLASEAARFLREVPWLWPGGTGPTAGGREAGGR